MGNCGIGFAPVRQGVKDRDFLLGLVDYAFVHGELADRGELSGVSFETPDLSWLSNSWVLPFVRKNWVPEAARRATFAVLSPQLDTLAGLPPLSLEPMLLQLHVHTVCETYTVE